MSPPTITNRNPATTIAIGATDPVGFDVLQGTAPFLDIWVAAQLGGTELYEVVWDGEAFAPLYAPQSSVESIAGGYRFRIRRTGGWPGAPTILTKAIDTAGLEAS